MFTKRYSPTLWVLLQVLLLGGSPYVSATTSAETRRRSAWILLRAVLGVPGGQALA